MKKITMDMRWIGWLLSGMGIFFLSAGIGIFLFVVNLEGLAPGEADVLSLVFLGAFGGVGLILSTIGLILGRRFSRHKRLKERLSLEGNYIWADVVDISRNSSMHVNGQSPFVLRCKYQHSDGNNYIFTSPYLRYNPESMLSENKVKVWIDRHDIRKYYVDVEGSIENGFIEL